MTARRTKVDFVSFVCRMLRKGYSRARKVHLVLDNLNTHLRESFEEVLGAKTAATVLRRVQFHYTPKHASWLNMAEIEIGVLQRQCLALCAARASHSRSAGDSLAAAANRRSMWHRVDALWTSLSASLCSDGTYTQCVLPSALYRKYRCGPCRLAGSWAHAQDGSPH